MFFPKVNRETIMEDAFIREHIEDLLRNIRTQVRPCHLTFAILTLITLPPRIYILFTFPNDRC